MSEWLMTLYVLQAFGTGWDSRDHSGCCTWLVDAEYCAIKNDFADQCFVLLHCFHMMFWSLWSLHYFTIPTAQWLNVKGPKLCSTQTFHCSMAPFYGGLRASLDDRHGASAAGAGAAGSKLSQEETVVPWEVLHIFGLNVGVCVCCVCCFSDMFESYWNDDVKFFVSQIFFFSDNYSIWIAAYCVDFGGPKKLVAQDQQLTLGATGGTGLRASGGTDPTIARDGRSLARRPRWKMCFDNVASKNHTVQYCTQLWHSLTCYETVMI